nr:hypothetical protein CFP56_46803 [Quercus suber]
MAYETIEQAPTIGDFTLLTKHQERTPDTFFGGKPVLYLHCSESRLRINTTDLVSQPDFAALEAGGGYRVVGDVVEIPDLEIWVSSSNSAGLQILYPAISIHAQDNDAVLLELNLSDSNTADEDLVFLQVRLVPVKIAYHEPKPTSDELPDAEDLQDGEQQQNGTATSPVEQLYDAISACQELNPDPGSEDEDQGLGFDPTVPGATGWITSENMQDFVGEDGEFRIPEGVVELNGEAQGEESLGQGAGRRRTANEVEDADGTENEDETKWQRTA